MNRSIKNYGWTPDLPDQRDHLYSAPLLKLGPLPARVNLRAKCPPVYDQGQLGSCTANAIGAAFQFNQLKQNAKKAFIPSRLFIYYNERTIEGTVREDSGAQIRDGIKSVTKQGVCPEKEWPYDIANFAHKPSPACYQDALKNQVTSYQRLVQGVTQMRGCLADGYPFVFGFSVYDAFESTAVARTGVLNLPGANEKMIGGHAVMAVGYDDVAQRFIIRNSWGTKRGQKGYFTMPYAYITDNNLADDFWTIRLVEED
jgi:C1A family cysteine protease